MLKSTVYFVCGFCIALLLILGWRYVSIRPSSTLSSPHTMNAPETHPPSRSPGIPWNPSTLAMDPLHEREGKEIREQARQSREGHPEVEMPPQLKAVPPEREVLVPHSPPSDQEALRRLLQDSLQQAIEEDNHFRAVLREAAKAHVEKEKKEKEEPR